MFPNLQKQSHKRSVASAGRDGEGSRATLLVLLFKLILVLLLKKWFPNLQEESHQWAVASAGSDGEGGRATGGEAVQLGARLDELLSNLEPTQ